MNEGSYTEDRGIQKTKNKTLKELYECDRILGYIWQQIVKPIINALGLKVSYASVK